MNWLDVILLLPLLVGFVRGIMRGLVSEIIAFVVIILGVLISRTFVNPFSQWLLAQFAWPQGICNVVAYVLIFLTVAIILTLFSRALTKLLRSIHLGWANRLAGGIFGFVKYGIFIIIIVFAMNRTNQVFHWLDDSPIVQSSVVYPVMVKATNIVVGTISDATDQVQ